MTIQLAIHGGAGAPPADPAAARVALASALSAGRAVLAAGGPALDAVCAAVRTLEASGCFNSGRGAVRDTSGQITLDAALMAGHTRRAGAVACVQDLCSPIHAARLVLERTRHVLLVGAGADAFARAQGAVVAPAGWFVAPQRKAAHGTVGAVARDLFGHCAAATSTGGIDDKAPGRVGDSPLIGAGTWADGRCAVSATGLGEYFIRTAFAHRIAVEVERGGALHAAGAAALGDVVGLGGEGGAIAVGGDAPWLGFSTVAMARGWLDAAGAAHVAIGRD
jgi:isoaspartyl peptidase/L-asparaginase-like protein (Ntn-hydrolase superfamily)